MFCNFDWSFVDAWWLRSYSCFIPELFKFGFVFRFVWISLSLVGGFFVSLFCMRQPDLRPLIAYYSVAHMSIVSYGVTSHTANCDTGDVRSCLPSHTLWGT